jgi:hypothetical protein
MEITPVLPFARQIFLPHISRFLEFFTVLQHFYLFLPQFPAEPQIMFCRMLVGKHRCRVFKRKADDVETVLGPSNKIAPTTKALYCVAEITRINNNHFF